MTIVGALPFNLQNGTTADATQVMADFNKIVNDTNTNGAHNGVNSDITALTALVTPITPAAGGTNVFLGGTSTGTANAQVVASPTPTGFALTVGYRIAFIAGFTNTGATTLNINSTGATSLFRYTPLGPVALAGGEVIVGNVIEAVFDGTRFQLLTNASTPLNSGYLALASATTTDVGTIPSHAVSITGTTTITSFGSTAIVGYPNYKLIFNGILTITYNATSMILPGGQSIVTAAGDTAEIAYAGSGNWVMISYDRRSGQPLSFSASFLQGYINGLILSTAGASTTMSIAAGVATDATNTQVMVGAASSKTTASWSVGAATGGLDTGSIAANTWYHFFEMMRPDTGVVDYCFSLSPTTPTTGGSIPAAYTLFRRIGSGKTNGSSQWTLFTQTGNTFIWDTTVPDQATVNIAATTLTLTVPTGVVVEAKMRLVNNNGGINSIIVESFQESDQATSTTLIDMVQNVTAQGMTANVQRWTNTSAQVRARGSANGLTLNVNTYGWVDLRGKS